MTTEYDNDQVHSSDEEEQNFEESERVLMDPTNVRERIDTTLSKLANLKTDPSRTESRSDLMESLERDLTEYFGYLPELCNMLLNLFSPAECVEYMEASDRPRPMVIRTNTLKTNRKTLMAALSKRGVNLETIDWSKVAIKITESSVPIGATPEYLAGHYMLQSAASMNPVMALAPLPGERVLDMSAAPGGKTSYIAQLMKNSGTLIANDLKADRQKATVANLHRLGVKNTVTCCYDGRKFLKVMKNFDRVLLDAPCSGLGVISRDQSVKLQRTLKDVQRVAHLQKELLCVAVDCCDVNSPTGGYIVYSTCSISIEENEQVVQYILNKRHVKLVDTGLDVGKPGFTRYQDKRFHPSVAKTRRFYPHVHNMDGFYVAKFKKLKNGVRSSGDDEESEGENEEDEGENEESEEENEEDEGENEESEEENEEDIEESEESEEEAACEENQSEENSEESEEEPSPVKPKQSKNFNKMNVAAPVDEEQASENKKRKEKIIQSAPAKRPKLNIQQLRARAAKPKK